MEELIKEYSDYAEKNGLHLNPDRTTVERIINGLLINEQQRGHRYCPCRRISGNEEEDKKKICPCAYHKDEIAEGGKCFCGLFVK